MSKKTLINSIVAMLFSVAILSLFSGCPPVAPWKTTTLEIGGPLVTDVLKAWETKWYKFEVENDNTPYLLIFKNLGDVEDAWLGYQRAIFYESKDGLVLLESITVPPQEPAEAIIIEDKAREFKVAPYKGTYYIRMYGYAQPVSENKKYELYYAIGLASPETYSGATSINVGSTVEELIVGDIYKIYRLEMSVGSAYRLQIKGTLNEDIYGKPEDNWKQQLSGSIVRVNEYNEEITITENLNSIEDYLFLIHPDDKNKYYLVLTGKGETSSARVKITLTNVTVAVNSGENPTVTIKGLDEKALKLNVNSNSSYRLKTEVSGPKPSVNISYLKVNSNGTVSTFYTIMDMDIFTVPNDNKDVYYVVLSGTSKATDANVKVTFEAVPQQ